MATALENLSWKEADVDSSMTTLRRYVEDEAQRQIDWYHRKRRMKATISTALRFSAIVLFIAGGLVPLVNATLPKLSFDFAESGYLLIALAGGCLALDRFFGYSSSWIRCVTTALAIEKSLEEFRMEWARRIARLGGDAPNAVELDQLIATCETFSLAIRAQVEQETKAWVAEFQSNLAQLERDLEAKAEEIKRNRQLQ